MDSKEKQELLDYYWGNEPVYHPTEGIPMPRRTVWKIRFLAMVLLGSYVVFTAAIVMASPPMPVISWLIGALAGGFCADLLSGLTHMYIDFGTSNRKNPIHKELFLSRVHHHELHRPAKLNYASLWFSPALSSFIVLGLIPAFLGRLLTLPVNLEMIGPFWLSLLWFSSFSQVAHAYAHGKAKHPVARKVVRSLQKMRLLIPPKVHGKHHREIDCNFSVLNGWSNPLLNKIFKKRIEAHVSSNTSPARQKADMKQNLSYPYEEIL